MEISPPVPEKIFEGFLPYMCMMVIIGHVTSIILMILHFFHVPKSLHKKLLKNGPVVSEESMF